MRNITVCLVIKLHFHFRRDNSFFNSMSYDLDGEKILICINVEKYPLDPDTGRSRDRYGSEKDENAIIETFKERIYRQLWLMQFDRI